MNLSTHVAVGAAVGYLSQNPVIGFFAGILSHHLIDSIPHSDGGALNVNVKDYARDKRIRLILAVDFSILVLVTILALNLQGYYLPMILGAFGGALPDLVDNVPFWTPKLRSKFPINYYHKMHEFFHYTIQNKKYVWTGIAVQVVLIVISLIVLI